MKFNIKTVLLLLLTVAMLLWSESPGLAAIVSSGIPLSENETKVSEPAKSITKDLPDFISMATELDNRSAILKKEIADLSDLASPQKSLAQMAKTGKKLSRKLKSLKGTARYSYDQLFELKSRISRETAILQKLIDSMVQAIRKAELWKNEWEDEGTQWEKLNSSFSGQHTSLTLEPTFAKVRQVISRSLLLITQKTEPMLAQLQAAQVIRASHSSLELELDALVTVLNEDLMKKTARSMFSFKYYFLLKKGLQEELPNSIKGITMPGINFVEQQGWLIILQILFSLLSCLAIFKQRHTIMESERWRFIARRPIDAGIFISAMGTSLFYVTTSGVWLFIGQCIVIISLARLVSALLDDICKRKKWFIYWLSFLLILARLFSVLDLPFSLFRLYIFSAAAIGILLCAWRSAINARSGDAPVYTIILRLGALLCLAILIAEAGGYSTLSAHLLECSLKTFFILLTGWMLTVMLRGFVECAIDYHPLRKIPFLQANAQKIISRSTLLIRLLVATLTGTFILVAWRVYSNLSEAMQAVFSFGINMGPRRISVGLIFTAAAFLYFAFLLSWAVQAMLMEGPFTRRQLQVGVRISMARLVHYAFVFLGFILALLTLGIQLRDLTIIAGALGVGIGFGLQGIVNNFVSGLILLFERPVKVGDFIELGEQQAEIKKIGLRATVVQTSERSEIVVPNSDLVSNQVTNWTLSDQYAGIKIPVKAASDANVSLVIKTLMECAEKNTQIAKHPAPQALFIGFGESALEFEVWGWISDINDIFQIKSSLRQEIHKRFHSLEIRIPFPQQDLHLHMAKNTVI